MTDYNRKKGNKLRINRKTMIIKCKKQKWEEKTIARILETKS